MYGIINIQDIKNDTQFLADITERVDAEIEIYDTLVADLHAVQELENTTGILQDQEKLYDNNIDELQETFKIEYEKLKKKHNEIITNLK